jgi:hypothetical protein
MAIHSVQVLPVKLLHEKPCQPQFDLLGLTPEQLHEQAFSAMEEGDPERLVSLLHHMASQDLTHAGKSAYLDFEALTSKLPDFISVQYENEFDSDNARAWGSLIGHWMAHKPVPNSHFWMGHLLYQCAENIVLDVKADRLTEGSMAGNSLFIETICSHLDAVQRDHHLGPLSNPLAEGFRNNSNHAALTALIVLTHNESFIKKTANSLIKNIFQSELSSWIGLLEVHLAETQSPVFMAALNLACKARGIASDMYLFDLLETGLSKRLTGVGSGYRTKLIQDFMLDNKDRIKPLAQHLHSTQNLKFFRGVLNLDLDFFFDKNELPSSAKRLILEDDLGM